ncbi:MAG TPA: recombinase family protein [Acidobacteriaceae bacterium]|nr:recombinase family protein [Acidobacteriaceae bacterium]
MNPLPDLDPSRCVVYRRVSSAEQERASGPARQRSACEHFAAVHGLSIVGDEFEDLSGTLPMAERPALARALSDCLELGAGVLLVEERTRLARDEYAAHDALRTFAHAGVRVMYADGSNGNGSSDPATMLLDGIGHAVAAYDRRVIVARMAAGRRAKAQRSPRSRAQGGKLPYGYRRSRDGDVEVDPEAAELVQRAFELVRGGKSIRAAAAELEWQPTMVARVLKRPEYKRAGSWRVVDPRIWNDAQASLVRRQKRAVHEGDRSSAAQRDASSAREIRESANSQEDDGRGL